MERITRGYLSGELCWETRCTCHSKVDAETNFIPLDTETDPFHKMDDNIDDIHLSNIVHDYVSAGNPYKLRNSTEMKPIHARTSS